MICSTGQGIGKSMPRISHPMSVSSTASNRLLVAAPLCPPCRSTSPTGQYYRSKWDVTSWCTGRKKQAATFRRLGVPLLPATNGEPWGDVIRAPRPTVRLWKLCTKLLPRPSDGNG